MGFHSVQAHVYIIITSSDHHLRKQEKINDYLSGKNNS